MKRELDDYEAKSRRETNILFAFFAFMAIALVTDVYFLYNRSQERKGIVPSSTKVVGRVETTIQPTSTPTITKKQSKKKLKVEKITDVVKKKSILQEHTVYHKSNYNRDNNLKIAAKMLSNTVILPGEEFSFWNIVGSISAKKGYLEGLVIRNGILDKGIGGGLCQMGNLIHWLVLHTPLQVTELHHHSDALFPDSKRRVPFGTGTSISYKAIDYRFKNTTEYPVQIRVWLDDTMLYGEIRSNYPLDKKYRIFEEDNHYSKDENGVFYRNSKVYRSIIDKDTKEELSRELILDNHSKVMYDYNLIPKDQIR